MEVLDVLRALAWKAVAGSCWLVGGRLRSITVVFDEETGTAAAKIARSPSRTSMYFMLACIMCRRKVVEKQMGGLEEFGLE